METLILKHAFILAMLMQAISAIFSEGMIFSRIGTLLETHMHFVWKMLMGCPVCMCPWYGAAMILAFKLSPLEAISIAVAMGINWVISNLYPHEPPTEMTINGPIHTTTGL